MHFILIQTYGTAWLIYFPSRTDKEGLLQRKKKQTQTLGMEMKSLLNYTTS